MLIPKYEIGDIVYIACMTLKERVCDHCNQPVFVEGDWEDTDRWIIETRKCTIEGYVVQQGMREREDGVLYQLSGEWHTEPEAAVHSTAEEAKTALIASLKSGSK